MEEIILNSDSELNEISVCEVDFNHNDTYIDDAHAAVYNVGNAIRNFSLRLMTPDSTFLAIFFNQIPHVSNLRNVLRDTPTFKHYIYFSMIKYRFLISVLIITIWFFEGFLIFLK